MEKYSTSLAIKDMQIKTTMRYYLPSDRMAVINKTSNKKCWRGCREKRTLIHCWWDCKLVQPLWKTTPLGRFLKKLGSYHMIQQPLFLVIYPPNLKTFLQSSIIPMFIVALCIEVKTWKQPEHPSIEDWTKKWYRDAREHCSAIRKDEILPFATILFNFSYFFCYKLLPRCQ